jgi:hypothetical protein
MRRLMANRRVQAGLYGVVLFVVTLTTRGGLVAAILLGLLAGLGWFAVIPCTTVHRADSAPRFDRDLPCDESMFSAGRPSPFFMAAS